MGRKNNILTVLLLCIFMTISLSSMSYATSVPVTDENLNDALQNFAESDCNNENYQISVADNIITLTSNDGTYKLNYDLANSPTFSFEVDIQQGMSYDDFKEQTDNVILPMIGYIAVANIQGVELEDASAYFLMTYLENVFNNSNLNENSYVIIDDTDMSDGVTINKDESDTKTIYVSEFGERVMEYVNATYKDKQTITDSSDGVNSYEYTLERKDVTETSCKLVAEVVVNLDADFSKLDGYSSQVEESFLNKNITEENADYLIKLKVGQKCNIESNEKITGYEISGYSCAEFSEDKTVITATSVGKANGYLYVGDSNTKKSIYIIVEENTLNQELEPITIKIETTDIPEKEEEKADEPETNTSDVNKSTTMTADKTVSKTTLPKAGATRIILIIGSFSICIIGVIVFGIKNAQNRDIK